MYPYSTGRGKHVNTRIHDNTRLFSVIHVTVHVNSREELLWDEVSCITFKWEGTKAENSNASHSCEVFQRCGVRVHLGFLSRVLTDLVAAYHQEWFGDERVGEGGVVQTGSVRFLCHCHVVCCGGLLILFVLGVGPHGLGVEVGCS